MPEFRKLLVCYESIVVGNLRETDSFWSFQYEENWVEKGFSISPHLPLQCDAFVDGASVRPVQQFFDNLLPEEAARKLMAQDAGINLSDQFALLEYYGAESAGALTLGSNKSTVNESPLLKEISREALSEKINNLPHLPLSHNSPKRMSLAGAQHKLPIVYELDRFFEPVGSAISMHILKPDHPDREDFPCSVANEWFCMTLAREVGLVVPDVFVFHIPESIYVVERFDRMYSSDATTEPMRLHMLDGCQLLGLSSYSKYDECTLDNLLQIIAACRKKLVTRITLFQWLVFNYLIGNGDAHLKNLSVFCDWNGLDLTPHYDLLSTTIYCKNLGHWMDEPMVTEIGGAKTFAEVTIDHWLEVAKKLNVPKGKAKEIIQKLPETVWDKARALEGLMLRAKEFDAGEQRLISTIVNGPIKEACIKLQVDMNPENGDPVSGVSRLTT